MEVDLKKIRADLEKELQDLERRKDALAEQLNHIESVERIAGGTLETEKISEEQAESGESESTEEGKSWFRR